MKDWLNIIKETVTFFGEKMDALAPKDSIELKIKGVNMITMKGDQGEKGDKGEMGAKGKDGTNGADGFPGLDGEDGKEGKPGKDGKAGKDGKDGKPGKDGKNGLPGKKGDDGSPDTGEQIIAKINKDKSGTVIKKEHVEGLSEIESMARTAEANSRSFGNTGSYVYDFDYSSLLNGVTKTFTLPQNAQVLLLLGSSDLGYFKKTTDYTWTGSTITFTSGIDASTVLSAGQTLLLLYKLV